MMPDQFFSLTPNELSALHLRHELAKREAQKMSAFTGYCAAAAVLSGFGRDGLPAWESFYREDEKEEETDDYVERFKKWI